MWRINGMRGTAAEWFPRPILPRPKIHYGITTEMCGRPLTVSRHFFSFSPKIIRTDVCGRGCPRAAGFRLCGCGSQFCEIYLNFQPQPPSPNTHFKKYMGMGSSEQARSILRYQFWFTDVCGRGCPREAGFRLCGCGS